MTTKNHKTTGSQETSVKEILTTGHSLRRFLNDELRSRCLRNPSYSLRSFAKDLNYDASNLCKYMNGTNPVTEKFFLNIKKQLGLNQESLESFEREYALIYRPNKVFDLNPEYASVLGGVQCFFLLEVLHLTHLNKTTESISQYLDIPYDVVEKSLLFLAEKNLVVKEGESWRHSGQIVKAKMLTDGEHRDFARESFELIQELFLKAYELNSNGKALNWSLVATDSSLMPEAKKKLAAFREELLSFLESSETKDTVFSYTVGLFPVFQCCEDEKI